MRHDNRPEGHNSIRFIAVQCCSILFFPANELGAHGPTRLFADGMPLWTSIGSRLPSCQDELVLEGVDSDNHYPFGNNPGSRLARSKSSRDKQDAANVIRFCSNDSRD
jgi:hypothetical protein